MPWANDKIRINYLSGVGGLRNIGKRVDTRDYDYVKPKRDHIDKFTETEELQFSLFPNFKNEFLVDYNPILDGLRTFIVLMTTDNDD